MRSLLIELAQAGGRIIRDHFEQVRLHDASSKGSRDYVSHVDRLSEDAIVTRIRRRFPEHAIIAEEGTAPEETPAFDDHRPCWIIDPLDGTTNFIHGLPAFAVSIAFCDRGNAIRHGIVYDPIRDEQFIAERDAGLWIGDRRVYTSDCKQIGEALVATGLPFRNLDPLDDALRAFAGLQRQVDDHRRGGCASLDLAYVAVGRLDAYYELGIYPWDVAAGELLVRCGGGKATDLDGGSGPITGRRSILAAATPVLHEAMMPHLGPLRAWLDRDPYRGWSAVPPPTGDAAG